MSSAAAVQRPITPRSTVPIPKSIAAITASASPLAIAIATVLSTRPRLDTDHQKYQPWVTRCVRVVVGRFRPGVRLSMTAGEGLDDGWKSRGAATINVYATA
jgi:hypothetical protein